jgi:C-terminal processing protease CtpA/Prc
VIPGTLADKDGRIQKGDRVLSINGKSTKGVTHRDALATLKVILSQRIQGLLLKQK